MSELPAWGSLPPAWLPQVLLPLHGGAVPPAASPVPTPVCPATVVLSRTRAHTLHGSSTSDSTSSSNNNSNSRSAVVVQHQSPSVNRGTRTSGAGAFWGDRDCAVGAAAPHDPPHTALQPTPTALALLGDAVVGNSEAEGAAGALPPANSGAAEGLAAGRSGGSGSSMGRGAVEPFPLELLPVLPRAVPWVMPLRWPPSWG